MWTTRNPIGGIWLTKSPNGTRIAPFRPVDPARVADPVGDDSDEAQDHADEDDEMGGVLPDREAGRRPGRGERVLGQVEDQDEGDRRGAGLRQAGDTSGGCWAGLGDGHRAPLASLSLTWAIISDSRETCQLFRQQPRAIE